MPTVSKEEQLDKFIADLWIAVTRMTKKTRQMGGQFAEDYDLTPTQMLTLWQLQEHGPMTMSELSELNAVTHGVATRMVDRLIKKGVVKRRRDVKDRRVVLISLTETGSRVTDEVVEEGMSMFRAAFKNVPQNDRQEFLALLKRIEKAQEGGPGQ